MKGTAACLLLILLAGCQAPGVAPIADYTQSRPATPAKAAARPTADAAPASTPAGPARPGEVVVRKGETLFAIAFQHGLDYRDLAVWNNLPSPDVIQAGQVLRLAPPGSLPDKAVEAEALPMRDVRPLSATPLQEPPLLTEPRAQRLPYSEANWAMVSGSAAQAPKAVDAPQAIAAPQPIAAVASPAGTEADEGWRWPADGVLTGRFGERGGKGINIAGEKKSPVLSAAAGKVVYSGSGLRGYGKMVIVKHAGEFLTAYAHNHAVLVKEGEWVKPGQKIAEMGDTDSEQVKLHFEVRQYGKPIDPLKILPERK